MSHKFASHPAMREDYTMPQMWDQYTADDHNTWKTLFERQNAILPGRACDEYMDALVKLKIGADKIPNFEELSAILKPLTGWEIVAVPGLIPPEPFFTHLANRRFPVTYWIRKPHEMDYLEEPDLFHDLFGHVPLLSNPIFGDYIAAYGRGGLKAMQNGGINYITRLFWYSVEFGLINTPKGLRIYGAGIVSSRGESQFALDSDSPNRIGFDVKRMMQTRYVIDDYQQTYYVIDSFEQLFEATKPDFIPYYEETRQKPRLEPGVILPTDKVYHLGTGEYVKKRQLEKEQNQA